LFGAAKVAIAAVSALAVLSVLSPLLVFFAEMMEDPAHFLSVAVAEASAVNGSAVLTVALNYTGSVPLTDFKLKIFGEELHFGTVTKGRHEKELVVPVSALANAARADIEMEFKVAGIYRLRVAVRGGGHGA